MINFQTTNTRSIKENKYNFTSLIENASSEKESVKRMISQVTGEEKIFANHLCDKWGFMVAQLVKSPPAMQETLVRFLGWEDSLEKDRLPIPVFLPRESLRTEEPGGLQSIGSQRVRHDRATKHSTTHVIND